MRHSPSVDDLDMIEYLINSGTHFLIAATKSDKLNRTERIDQLQLFQEMFSQAEGLKLIPFSSVKGEGVDEIRNIISEICEHS